MRIMRMSLAALLVATIGLADLARADEVVVERRRTGSPAGTIVRDTFGGALLGAAVAGGIILYQREVEDNSDYDWQRTLAWGTLIGAGAGLVLGIVDATSHTYESVRRAPYRDGSSLTLDLRRVDQSHRTTFRLLSRRF